MRSKRLFKKSACLLLAALFTLCQTGFAADAGSIKDETVYVNLDYDGSVQNTIVVNSFTVSGNKKLIDYGNYKNIKNLSSTAKPIVKNGFIEWDVDENSDRFYYQGELTNAALPWDFKISYTLDGKPVTAEALAGASGSVGITIDAQANENADSYYKENYMAQITVAVDTQTCKNINAPDAMGANVGSTRQMTLMVLPSMSKTYTITMDAQNFELDAITIAMVKVSDGILSNIDNVKLGISDITSNISALIDGTGQLKNGASDLAEGLSMLNTGAQSLSQASPLVLSALNEFGSGIDALHEGAGFLSAGSTQVRNGLSELDANSYAISKGISQVSGGLYEMTKNKQTVRAGLAELEKSKSAVTELESGAQTLRSGYKQIETGLNTMAGNSGTIVSGMSALQSANTDLSPLSTGVSTLQAGIGSVQAAGSQQAALVNALAEAAKNDPNLAPYLQQIGALQALTNGINSGLAGVAGGAAQGCGRRQHRTSRRKLALRRRKFLRRCGRTNG